MKSLDICVFLTSFTLCVAVASIFDWLRCRNLLALCNVVLALAAVAGTTVIGFFLEPGTSYLALIFVLLRERDISSIVATGLGVAGALVWYSRLVDLPDAGHDPARSPWWRASLGTLLLSLSLIGVVICAQAFVWKEILGFQRDPPARVLAREFVIEQIADLEFAPTRITVNEQGKVYVCYDHFESWGDMGGGIIELTPDPVSGEYQRRIVADSALLMRCYGLATRGNDLYVSRSGIRGRAARGNVTYDNVGAVTVLKDLDGDGYFEYLDDLVNAIPGARGPVTMQQNNGIAFAPDGSLFVTTASAGDRSLEEHPWDGCVLKLSPGQREPEVFARGFRNPFGIVIGPDDEVFVTDNDIDENPGDELNHVIQGEHYGHPFVVPNEHNVEATGFREPILVSDLESNYLGMAYATSPAMPPEFRNCIYLTDYMGDAVLRLKLVRDGDTYRVDDIYRLAALTTPLDIAAGPDGDLFVITRRTQNVYRIRPRTAVAEAVDAQ